MTLDPTTLMVVSSLMTGLSGVLLFGAWILVKDAPALLWWSVANLAYAVGLVVVNISAVVAPPAAMIGAAFITMTPALVWAGVRCFEGRRISLPLVGMGVAAWLAIDVATMSEGPSTAALVLSLGNWVVYLFAAVGDLWGGRRERLNARWPLMGLLGLHGGIHVLGILDALDGEFRAGIPSLGGLFGAIYFEGLLYAMGSAIFMVVMCIQRNEARLSRVAQHDALTGAASRGAFFESAERLRRRCLDDGAPYSVVLFDLDRFKTINDNFGHQVGDRVIQGFATAARRMLRPNDLFGRYGGEEFIAFLPGTTVEAAFVIADRVRAAFVATEIEERKQVIAATVSAGVASTRDGALDETISAADDALYRAKALGRNRVHAASPAPDPGGINIIRVA